LKRIVFVLVVLSLVVLSAVSGCGGNTNTGSGSNSPGLPSDSSTSSDKPGAKGVVNVFNWGLYIEDSILDDFQNETGIRVNYSEFQSNEEMYSSLKLGAANYDVIFPSDYMVSRMSEEGMLEELNFSNIPNYILIDDIYKDLEYDPEGSFSVAYMT